MHQSRLAGPVVADKSDAFPALDVKIDPVERLDGTEGLRDAL
jgi:hypothetical protein